VALVNRAYVPIAKLFEPVVFAFIAPVPIAVLVLPEVFTDKVEYPKDVLVLAMSKYPLWTPLTLNMRPTPLVVPTKFVPGVVPEFPVRLHCDMAGKETTQPINTKVQRSVRICLIVYMVFKV
jgi:hypothetical protein